MNNLNKLTVREIRTILFDTNKYAILGSRRFTNKEARVFFYEKENQEAVFNVIENDSHLLISEIR